MDYPTTLAQLREARSKGLTVPVLLMGESSVRSDSNQLFTRIRLL